jgi:hypothetical protein
MARPAAGRKENYVKAQIAACFGRMTGEPELRSARDSGGVNPLQRGQFITIRARFNLDKGNRVPTLDNEVYLTKRRFVAAVADAVEFGLEKKCGKRLAAMASALGPNALVSRRL